ncbi:hypothetical protein OK016_21625 [Vibrio chagasii]|nr:hypothetical protein [Vibrio chagasii]
MNIYSFYALKSVGSYFQNNHSQTTRSIRYVNSIRRRSLARYRKHRYLGNNGGALSFSRFKRYDTPIEGVILKRIKNAE